MSKAAAARPGVFFGVFMVERKTTLLFFWCFEGKVNEF